MLHYKRANNILKYLIFNNYPIKISELEQIFNVKERTIKYDIKNINQEISKYNIKIKNIRNLGYMIILENKNDNLKDIYNKIFLNNNIYEQNLENSDDRIIYILKLLLFNDEYVNFYDLAQNMFISESTMNQDLKKLKSILKTFNLKLKTKSNIGTKLIGNEFDKREIITNYIIERKNDNYITYFTKNELEIFQNLNLEYIKRIVLEEFNKSYIVLHDFNLKNIISHFALSILRIKSKNIMTENIKYSNDENLNKIYSKFENIINNITIKLENEFNVKFNMVEKKYILLHFIKNSCDIEKDNIEKSKFIVDQMLNYIYNFYKFDLRDDTELHENLVNHINSVLYFKSLNIENRNPIMKTIRCNLNLAFEMAQTCANFALKNHNINLSNDDLGFIAIHLAVALEKFSPNVSKLNILIINTFKFQSSQLIKLQLENYYQNSIKIADIISYTKFNEYDLKNIDLIISDITIKTLDIPIINVGMQLVKNDFEKINFVISKKLQQEKFLNFFSKDLFFKKDFDDKLEAIDFISDKLYKKGIVYKNFKQNVIKREAISTTVIDEDIAIPHPIELCSKKTKLTVLISEKGILWDDDTKVKLLIFFSVKKEDFEDLKYIFKIFMQIIENYNLKKDIISSKNFDEFINHLNSINLY